MHDRVPERQLGRGGEPERPGQLVVSGARDALERVAESARAGGAKRVLPLKVGGPFHSVYMRPAADAVCQALAETPLRRADIPVVVNASARATQEPDELRHELAVQVYSAVRWTETLERLAELGCDRFLEVGPGHGAGRAGAPHAARRAGRQFRRGRRSARGVFAALRRFEGKVALVTGASRGIGRAIALRLAAEGANIVVNYNAQLDAANQVAEAAESVGSEVAVVQADVARPADVDRLVQAALDRFKRIDVLINNAGITRDTLIMRMSEDDWDAVLDTNLKSAFLVTKAVLRPMLRQRAAGSSTLRQFLA